MKRVVYVGVLGSLIAAASLLPSCGDQSIESPDASVGPSGKTVKVTYKGASTDVFLSQATPVVVSGASLDRLSDVVALGLPGKSPAELVAINFIGSDGYSPQSKGSCAAMLPIAGPTLAKGYVDPVTRNVKWDDAH
jgi:hypothetical protein